jgi:hypothetical protein
MDSSAVLYNANENVSITSGIFKTWLMSWGMELQQKSKKIQLLLDNCAAHPHLESLKNIQLEFVSLKTTPLEKPIYMGTIKNMKISHCEKLVYYVLEAI